MSVSRTSITGLLLLTLSQAAADDIAVLKKVGDESAGAAAARKAAASLIDGGRDNLVPLLTAFKGSSPLASNWLRSTFESIADAELKAGRDLPKDRLLEFVADTKQSPVARRLAYEWLLKRSPALKDELIPKMLLDPSPDFRRDAVAQLIEQAKSAGDDGKPLWQKALQGAVHEDQVTAISKALKKLDVEVDVQAHFGFLASWKIVGPFDNKEEKGYAIAYPPEAKIDLSAEYDGQLDKASWQDISTKDDFGVVNIAEDIKNHKGSLMYATTTWNSAVQQDLEIRLGTPNAWKLWVNGELLFEREEYHRSTRMDQYRIPVSLKAGENQILLKVCQNEQTQPWAQRYQFQLRICDATGAAVPEARQTASR